MKKKYFKYGLVAVICIMIISGIFMGVSSNKRDANSKAASSYATAKVIKGDIKVTASGTGTVAASLRKEVKPQDTGIVDKVLVTEGQLVKKGNLILTLESDSESVDIERAKLSLSLEEKELNNLQKDMENLKIYAPASGVVGNINANIGEELSKGYLLTNITDKTKMELIALYNGSQVSNIEVGQEAEVFLPDFLQTFDGTVTKVGETGLAYGSGAILYEVTVEIENPGGLTPGTLAQVTIKNDKGSFPAVEDTKLEMKSPRKVNLAVGGILKCLYVSSGDYVEKGELLAELESPDLQARIENQEIKVEQKKLELSEKLKQLDNTAVYAPISGTVLKINVTEGDNVSPNTQIAIIADLNNLEVVVPIDELDIGKVKIGQPAVVTAEAIPNTKFTAEVVKIALEGTSRGGVATFDVTLRIKDTGQLRPGMTVNAEIITAIKNDVLLLPVEAIQKRGDRNFVILEGEQQEDQSKPNIVPIKIGLVSEDYVEVVEGLKEGDTVIYPSVEKTQQLKMNQMGGMAKKMIPGGGKFDKNRRNN